MADNDDKHDHHHDDDAADRYVLAACDNIDASLADYIDRPDLADYIDDKPAPWKLRADLIDALALWFIGDDVDYAARDAAHALVAALRSGDVRPG